MNGPTLDLWGTASPPLPAPGARVLVGTSGYSFRDWVGPFYPPGTRPADQLRYYATRFPAVEVNSSYYAIPRPEMAERMTAKTPAGFRFVVKLHREMTHERRTDPGLYEEFQRGLAPMRAAGRLDGWLAQFPGGFRRSPVAMDHLRLLRERFAGDPLFVEFRHDSWATPELEGELRDLDLGYCIVDEPALPGLMPPVVLLPSRDAYVRFHGRNERNWWGRGGGDRYDYLYREDELGDWLRKITELADRARRTYLFFNNCHAGQAARNAALMQEMLRQQGLG